MPVLDAVSQGYIIPLWSDLHVKVSLEEGHLKIWCKHATTYGEGDITNHSWNQVGDQCDLKKFKLGSVLMSLLILGSLKHLRAIQFNSKNPSSNWENDIQLIEGVVDTDGYHIPVNFPYVWTGNDMGEWIIPKGTPLVQVIPFKREKMNMEIEAWDRPEMDKVDQNLASIFKDKYQKLIWHKRKQTEI